VKHILVAVLVIPLVASGVFALLNWVFRARGSSFPLAVSVISQWLVMYLVWALVGTLIQSYDLFDQPGRYTKYGFGIFAIVFGLWQYRLARAGAITHAARVFLWSQLGWLCLVLADHGVLG